MIIGFIVAMITSTILVIIVNTTNVFGILIVPLVITSFFECGGAAVIGEGQGGLRGAVIGTIAASFVMVLLVGVSAVLFSTTIQNWILIFGGNDLSLWGIIGRGLGSLFGEFNMYQYVDKIHALLETVEKRNSMQSMRQFVS